MKSSWYHVFFMGVDGITMVLYFCKLQDIAKKLTTNVFGGWKTV